MEHEQEHVTSDDNVETQKQENTVEAVEEKPTPAPTYKPQAKSTIKK